MQHSFVEVEDVAEQIGYSHRKLSCSSPDVDKCTLCGQMYSMGTSVLYGDKCSLWGQVYFMGISVLYGDRCTLWGQVYFMGISVLYGDNCTL